MATIRIVSWNVNGIRAAHRKGFLDWFEEDRPDILCVQETKAQEEQFPADLRGIDGYHKFYSSAEKKGYSGVALYTAMEPVGVEPGFGIERFDSEGRTLQVDMGDFVLFNVYFPNGKSSDERLAYKMDFYEAFLDHIESLRSQGRNIVVCGDVNTAHKPIDLARPKANEKISGFLPIEREWIDKLIERGLRGHLQDVQRGAGPVFMVESTRQLPCPERRVAYRLLLRKRRVPRQRQVGGHPPGRDGIGPLPDQPGSGDWELTGSHAAPDALSRRTASTGCGDGRMSAST